MYVYMQNDQLCRFTCTSLKFVQRICIGTWYSKNDIPGTNWTKFSFREVPGLYITHRSNPSGSNRVHRYKKTSNHGKTNTLF